MISSPGRGLGLRGRRINGLYYPWLFVFCLDSVLFRGRSYWENGVISLFFLFRVP
jgi:hypothetical protein